ncbi:hypothetical protein VARIO8X_150010 [Burkholderiales bacterium 8X]|nr:hypothetical protein VARIO8X_150010 [Burkholderiales bacterium 8X]
MHFPLNNHFVRNKHVLSPPPRSASATRPFCKPHLSPIKNSKIFNRMTRRYFDGDAVFNHLRSNRRASEKQRTYTAQNRSNQNRTAILRQPKHVRSHPPRAGRNLNP